MKKSLKLLICRPRCRLEVSWENFEKFKMILTSMDIVGFDRAKLPVDVEIISNLSEIFMTSTNTFNRQQ